MLRSLEEPRKSGCFGVVFTLLILVGITAGALHYFGKLQPLIDRARNAVRPSKVEGKTPSSAGPVEKVEPGAPPQRVPAKTAVTEPLPV